MQREADVEKQLAWALGMLRKHGHAYDAGYADALAWVLGRPAPSKEPEGVER
jgi:hypothetical protein